MPARPLAQKTALVTGGSRNIGRGIAERLAGDGARLAIGYHGDDEAARATVQAIEAAGGKAKAIQADVGDEAAVAQLFDEAEAFLGRLDIVVHNAGAQGKSFPFAETDLDVLDRYLRVNARGAFVVLQAAARRVVDGGRIVAITSSVIRRQPEGLAAYAGSKAAAAAYVQTLARELGPRGITVNAVLPGPTKPPEEVGSEPEDEADARRSVFGRVGHPRDIAAAVAFLVSEEARWVTGNQMLVSGGAYL